jgi:hypothetical protein
MTPKMDPISNIFYRTTYMRTQEITTKDQTRTTTPSQRLDQHEGGNLLGQEPRAQIEALHHMNRMRAAAEN